MPKTEQKTEGDRMKQAPDNAVRRKIFAAIQGLNREQLNEVLAKILEMKQ